MKNQHSLPAGMFLDSQFGIRLFLVKTLKRWSITDTREYGSENFAFFGFEGLEIHTSSMVIDAESFSERIKERLSARESEWKRYPYLRSFMTRRELYF